MKRIRASEYDDVNTENENENESFIRIFIKIFKYEEYYQCLQMINATQQMVNIMNEKNISYLYVKRYEFINHINQYNITQNYPGSLLLRKTLEEINLLEQDNSNSEEINIENLENIIFSDSINFCIYFETNNEENLLLRHNYLATVLEFLKRYYKYSYLYKIFIDIVFFFFVQ
jgi:hypothetical protein